MKILLTGPLPPHPGGGAISRAQLAAGFARAGHRVCCVSPITHEAARNGDGFAEAHPELQVARYPLRNFDPAPFLPPAEAFLREEKEQVQSLVAALLRSFAPDLVVVGRETFARYVPQLALAAAVPSVLLVRGSPTGHILSHRFPERDAEELLAEWRTRRPAIELQRLIVSRIRDPLTNFPERGARMARRDDREYREYSREEQRSQPGCPARKMSTEL